MTAYKWLYFTLNVAFAAVLAGYTFTLSFKSQWLTGALLGAAGFVKIGSIGLATEIACELSYPVTEAFASGVLNLGGQLLSLAMTSVSGVLFGSPSFSQK